MGFYEFAKGAVSCLYHLLFRIRIDGIENIPKDEAFVVCANHKSNLDPPMLGVCMPVRLRYMAKEELFHNPVLGNLVRALGAFPIKRGKSDIGALRASMKMIQAGEPVAVFPEGGRSHKGYMRKGKQGAALIAVKSGVNVLPVGIRGGYRPFHRIEVRIGKVIPLDAYFGKKLEAGDLQEITDAKIMPAIAALAGVKTYEDRDS